MVYLTIKNNSFIVSSDNINIIYSIKDKLTFQDSSRAFRRGKFDRNLVTYVKFFKTLKNIELPSIQIPIGFLDMITNSLEKASLEYKILSDSRKFEKLNPPDINIDLYEHQKEALEAIKNNLRGIIMSPTGSGKTEIFIAALSMFKSPSLVLFNRQQLAHQTLERCQKRGLEAGIIQGKNVLEKDITIATIQSIEKIDNIKKYKNLIIDEVHNASSNSYQLILKLPHWKRVYGFSATPINLFNFDLKSAKIVSYIGPIIYRADSNELIKKKIISKPIIRMVEINQPEDIEDFDYQLAEKIAIVNNKFRNKKIAEIANLHKNKKVLIMSKYIEQGENIAKLIPNAPFIHHKIKTKERIEIVKNFDEGDLNVLIASRILDEGIDIKSFNVLIIASAGVSFYKTIQRLGRGLRVTKDKDKILVYDFIDKTHRILYKHSKNRIKTYKKFGYTDIEVIK